MLSHSFSSSLSIGGGGNPTNVAGTSSFPSPSKPTWAQILNSNLNSSSSSTTTATTAATATTTTTTTGRHQAQSSSTSDSNATSISSNSISSSPINTAFNLSQTHSNFPSTSFEQENSSASQTNWSLNFNPSSTWMMDDETHRHSNLAGASSSHQSLESNQHTSANISAAMGDGTSSIELSLSFSPFVSREYFR